MKAEVNKELIEIIRNELKWVENDYKVDLWRDCFEISKKLEAHHKSKVEAISDERPKIEDTLGNISLSEVHKIYSQSPLLFMHIKLLDKYIDQLLKQ